jgi:glycosyltransferase involved in cell wall biosynthesis
MRVLWFSNTPSLAAEALNYKENVGGWIASLEKEINKLEGIKLGVAFPFGYSGVEQIELGPTNYFTFPVFQEKNGKLNLFSRWKHDIEPEQNIEYFLEIVEQFKPDIVHIFGTEKDYGLIIGRIKQPVIIQIQGNLSVYEKKWFSGLSNYNVFKYSEIKKIILGHGMWHLFFLFRKRAKRERKVMKKCLYFIGRTDWDRRITRVFSPKSKYFHCEELLRTEFFKAKKWTKPVNSKIRLISTLSSMSYKGIETVLETINLLNKSNLLDIEWHIVGIKGIEEIIKITEKVYQLKFSEYRVKFLGNLDPDELIEELLQANIYVHPSHIENSPNSVCEAMLLGMPIIATYAGGTPSIINNEIEGILVQDGDPYSLAGAIYELINDENLIQRISENAKIKAEARHDSDKVVSDLLNIYSTVLSEHVK